MNLKMLFVFIITLIQINAMHKPHELSPIQASIKMRTERIGQLKYSIAMLKISVAGLRAKLGIYQCSPPKLVSVSADYWSSSDSESQDEANEWVLFD